MAQDLEPPSTLLISGMSLQEVSVHYWKDPIVLGVMSSIIECESEWNPLAFNPNSTAHGLGQFLDGTWSYVQDKWDIQLERDSYYDQLYATERLLKEEGITHWLSSIDCWKS